MKTHLVVNIVVETDEKQPYITDQNTIQRHHGHESMHPPSQNTQHTHKQPNNLKPYQINQQPKNLKPDLSQTKQTKQAQTTPVTEPTT
jgi:hypothetical protein